MEVGVSSAKTREAMQHCISLTHGKGRVSCTSFSESISSLAKEIGDAQRSADGNTVLDLLASSRNNSDLGRCISRTVLLILRNMYMLDVTPRDFPSLTTASCEFDGSTVEKASFINAVGCGSLYYR